jgi:hypothetical protein
MSDNEKTKNPDKNQNSKDKTPSIKGKIPDLTTKDDSQPSESEIFIENESKKNSELESKEMSEEKSDVDSKKESNEESEDELRKKRRKARAERRRKGKTKKTFSKWQMARKGALLLFAVVGAYLMIIHIDLIIQTLLKKNYQVFPLFFQKYLLIPIAFEGGFFLATMVMLYLLGRFIDLPLWPTLLTMIILTHALDFGVKSIISQSDLYYLSLKPWLLRIPGILLTILVGRIVLRLALLREEE